MKTAEEIKTLLSGKFRIKPVPMPELGDGEVTYVRSLDAERDTRLNVRDFPVDANGKTTDNRLQRAIRTVASALCDDKGAYLYSQADEAQIGTWDSIVVDKLFAAAVDVSLTDEQRAERDARRKAIASGAPVEAAPKNE
jgi:hypothetical protein